MRRERIERKVRVRSTPSMEALRLDPRDPDIVRAKALALDDRRLPKAP